MSLATGSSLSKAVIALQGVKPWLQGRKAIFTIITELKRITDD
jgi:hypothetical protein